MSFESIRLRPANPRDEGFLRLVYAESRREELDQAAWPPGVREEFLRSQFDAQASHYRSNYPGAEFLIIECDGQPAGRLYVRRAEAEIRIMDIALIPAFRGKGIGTALLGQILAEGQASARIVTIHVEKFNPALRLYERLGFQTVEERGAYWFLQWSPRVS
ncbi:MAG: GNAT family N-acetyltransferase [Saprospiraceae bacterium]